MTSACGGGIVAGMRLDLPDLPRRLPPGELLTPDQMAMADRAAPGLGVSGLWLMENAGRAVARAILRRFRACRTLVLCGPGNNGGDGYVAARLLQQEGWPIAVAALAPPRAGSDAAAVAARWRGPRVPFAAAEASRAALVIDAVFGAGLARDVGDEVAAVLAAARRIVAVDVPSGVDGATGAARGAVAAAALTVTFARFKPGHWLLPGRMLCGELALADIGLPEAAVAAPCAVTRLNLPTGWRVPVPGAEGHKYGRGHVTVLGGPAMTGAARLAAGAAQRGGAGLVTIAAREGAATYRAGDPGVIVSEQALVDLVADERRSWVCGPGLGAAQAAAALPVLLPTGRVVVDADALTVCARAPRRLRGAAVLTPHLGEFTRVFGAPGEDRPGAVLAAARATGAVVLLKGADTLIADPDGRVAINASAPPTLATAGAGDVLAGLIASLLAQGMAPFEAACAGAWLHGRAAVLAGSGLIAEDLLAWLSAAKQEAGRWIDVA